MLKGNVVRSRVKNLDLKKDVWKFHVAKSYNQKLDDQCACCGNSNVENTRHDTAMRGDGGEKTKLFIHQIML